MYVSVLYTNLDLGKVGRPVVTQGGGTMGEPRGGPKVTNSPYRKRKTTGSPETLGDKQTRDLDPFEFSSFYQFY